MTEHPDKLDTGFIEYILSAYRASTKEHSGSGAQREEKKSENAQWHEPGLNHFISFIDEMPGGFFIYRAGGTEEIIYANRALLRIFNCHTMAEFRVLTGNSFRGIVHPDDLERVESSITTQVGDSRYDLDYVEYRIIPGVEVSVGLMIMGILYGIRRLGMFFMYLWQMPQNGNAIR